MAEHDNAQSNKMDAVMVKRFGMLSAACFVAGCSSTTGVLSLGPDTFHVSASSAGPGGFQSAQRDALNEANAHCRSLGKEILVSSTDGGYGHPRSNYSVTFACLASNDPALVRPTLRQVPNVVIEDRRN